MSQRFWTADFHLGMTDALRFEKRPFKSIDEMNAALISACKKRVSIYTDVAADGSEFVVDKDTIIHVGDLASFKSDRGNKGLEFKPARYISQIPALFINIRGNHDLNNGVKSICDMMRVKLGSRFPNVSVSHYPSYHEKATGNFKNGDIHICGHVHRAWKHCVDLDHQVLNINVGVDVWNYQIISDDELIQYISKIFTMPKEQITKVRKIDGKITFI